MARGLQLKAGDIVELDHPYCEKKYQDDLATYGRVIGKVIHFTRSDDLVLVELISPPKIDNNHLYECFSFRWKYAVLTLRAQVSSNLLRGLSANTGVEQL